MGAARTGVLSGKVESLAAESPRISCYATADGEFSTATFSCMTIPFTLRLRGGNEQLVESIASRAWSVMDRVDRIFSPFRPDSYTSAFNDGDRRGLLEDPWFYEVYARCLFAADETQGFFQPMHAERFDPVGLVKGWAIERAFSDVVMPAIDGTVITGAAFGGGGDLQVAVADGVSFTWGVGIERPRGYEDERELAGTVRLRQGAVATSGISKRGEHIAYPRGRAQSPKDDVVQATVIASSLTDADIWATAAVAAGLERFSALFPTAVSVQACLLITRDGRSHILGDGSQHVSDATQS